MNVLTTPAFAHAARLAPTKTTRVHWPAGEAGAQAMGELVDNDTSLKVAVTVRVRCVPEIHPAATVLTIRRGPEQLL
jgi:hypothetical protein